jgi:putative transposase
MAGKPLRAAVPGDLVDRTFTASAPNTRWVADSTYVMSWAGFVYVAFVVDIFAQRIVGWHAGTTKHTGLVLTCLRIATWQRDCQGHRVVAGQTDCGTVPAALICGLPLRLEGGVVGGFVLDGRDHPDAGM